MYKPGTLPGVTSITSTAGGWSYRRNMSKHKPIWSLAAVAVLMLPAVASGQEVTGFVLVDASTDLDIGPLTDGDTIDLDVVGDQLNIRAEVTGPVESVRFGLDGTANYQTESTPPYALAGDSGGNYNPWTPGLGGHTLIATPYPEDNAGGVAGTPLEIDFTVTRTPPTCPPVTGGTAIISGDLFRWHTVTASFAGPDTSEQAALNPFLDLRLDVTFTNDPSGQLGRARFLCRRRRRRRHRRIDGWGLAEQVHAARGGVVARRRLVPLRDRGGGGRWPDTG